MSPEDPWRGLDELVNRRLSSEQFAALDRVGLAYSKGKVSFETAVECRDLIRARRIAEALAVLQLAKLEPRKVEAAT